MTIGIVGGGILGLTAAYRLAKKGHKVVVFEKESTLGGLASSFEFNNFSLERYFHHIFRSDKSALSLILELGLKEKLLWRGQKTAIWDGEKLYPFSGALDLIRFPKLNFFERLRLGVIILYLKLKKSGKGLEAKTAFLWLEKWMGKKAFAVVWKLLFEGKFGKNASAISMAWFWSRIYKRSFSLGYLKGGFKQVFDILRERIESMGGEVKTNFEVSEIGNKNGKVKIKNKKGKEFIFDKILITTSPQIFLKIVKGLPSAHRESLAKIKYIGARSVVLVLKACLTPWYWININERKASFLALVEHTNFMSKKDYGGKHLLYLGNYLEKNDPWFLEGEKVVIKKAFSFLKKINPKFKESWVEKTFVFKDIYAQPIVTVEYKDFIPPFRTPIRGLYFASMVHIFPHDRGMNYSIELGNKVASVILKDPELVEGD